MSYNQKNGVFRNGILQSCYDIEPIAMMKDIMIYVCHSSPSIHKYVEKLYTLGIAIFNKLC